MISLRDRDTKEFLFQLGVLTLFAVLLFVSNSRFTIIDDETKIIAAAGQPVRTTVALFWEGVGQHEHPPLYDLILHFWLRATAGAFQYLRLLSIFSYCAGLLVLARAAGRLAGRAAATAMLCLGVMWPFGFHYGRLATWYGFSFLVVSAMTSAYLSYMERPSIRRWLILFLFCVALVWTNYFGWAFLTCLTIDQVWRRRHFAPVIDSKVLILIGALLCITFLPLVPAFRHEIHSGASFPGLTSGVFNALFCVYSLFASEAVAPWLLWLAVPVALSAAASVFLIVVFGPTHARQFLSYGAFLIALMAITGILNTRRLLLIAPWLLLPVAIGMAATKPRWAGVMLSISLAIASGIGWFGIITRQYYSAPRFIEPWREVAREAATDIQNGDIIVAENPSFLFYLDNLFHIAAEDTRVKLPTEFVAKGFPATRKVLWVQGMSDVETIAKMTEVAEHLENTCRRLRSRRLMRDAGQALKKRFFPNQIQLEWRIEIREYDCALNGD